MSLNTSNFSKNRTYAPVIMALSIILAFVWSFPSFNTYSENSMTLEAAQAAFSKQEQELKKYEAVADISSSPNKNFIEKISKKFSESAILEDIMLNNRVSGLGITNVSIDRGTKLGVGIYQGKITVNVVASSIDAIVDYIDKITNQSGYAFVVTDINLPINMDPKKQTQESYTVPITFGIYYYQ